MNNDFDTRAESFTHPILALRFMLPCFSLFSSLKLRRYFSDILMDQLPLLRELKRLIEELSIMEPPPPTASSLAIIEQIPEMREGIIRDVDWKKIAETQKVSGECETGGNKGEPVAGAAVAPAARTGAHFSLRCLFPLSSRS